MAEIRYNPLTDNFTTYEAIETPKVTLDMPLYGKVDISDWSSGISSTGVPMLSSQTKKKEEKEISNNIFDRDRVYEEQPENITTVNKNNSGNTKKAMDFFISKGLQPYLAAGIVGNLMVESHRTVKPDAVNPTSGAYGIALWLGPRKKSLFGKYGKNPTLEQQLEFLWEEFLTTEKRAFNKLLNSANVDDAVNVIMKYFERPSSREMATSISTRLKYGRSLLSL